MARKDIVQMGWKVLKKIKIINKALDKAITQKEAADVLDLSGGQIIRIVKRIKEARYGDMPWR